MGGTVPKGTRVPAGKTIQPKFGFELEIPVTFLTDKMENVDGKLTYLDGPLFKVVGDKSSIAGQMKGDVDGQEVLYSPTILEIVTKPIDEHADDADLKLREILDAIELFRFGLYLETNGFKKATKLKELADKDLKLVDGKTGDFLINVPTATERTASAETGYIHVTVGVSIEALQRAGEWTRNHAVGGYPGTETQTDAKKLINSTALFQYLLMNTPPSTKIWDEVENFLYLAYSHVRAIDRHESEDTRVIGGGTKKNYTPFLSRTPFHQVFKSLHRDSKEYITTHKENLKKILKDHLHKDGQEVAKAQTYLNNIFDQAITPQVTYFGGMVERPMERTGKIGSDLVGPPVEIRPLGTTLSEKEVRKVVAKVFDASRNQFKDTRPKQELPLMTELVLL